MVKARPGALATPQEGTAHTARSPLTRETSAVTRLPVTGKNLRDALQTSYNKLSTVTFTDPDGTAYTVHFDDFEEQVRNPRTQLLTPSCHCAVLLGEA